NEWFGWRSAVVEEAFVDTGIAISGQVFEQNAACERIEEACSGDGVTERLVLIGETAAQLLILRANLGAVQPTDEPLSRRRPDRIRKQDHCAAEELRRNLRDRVPGESGDGARPLAVERLGGSE